MRNSRKIGTKEVHHQSVNYSKLCDYHSLVLYNDCDLLSWVIENPHKHKNDINDDLLWFLLKGAKRAYTNRTANNHHINFRAYLQRIFSYSCCMHSRTISLINEIVCRPEGDCCKWTICFLSQIPNEIIYSDFDIQKVKVALVVTLPWQIMCRQKCPTWKISI